MKANKLVENPKSHSGEIIDASENKKEPSKEIEELRDKIVEESKKGNIVICTIDGLQVAKIEDMIKQPADGILYDVNRDFGTIMTFLRQGEMRWINDYASSLVIRALKNRIDELENK